MVEDSASTDSEAEQESGKEEATADVSIAVLAEAAKKWETQNTQSVGELWFGLLR